MRPAYDEPPRPFVPCTITSQGDGTFSIDATNLPEHAVAYVTLVIETSATWVVANAGTCG